MKKILLICVFCHWVAGNVFAQIVKEKVSPDLPESPKVMPVLFHQYSAEYKALCYQAFNLATMHLNSFKKKKKQRVAIITDVDETILDNSKYEAQLIVDGTDYTPATWHAWTAKAEAALIPGAAEFLQSANKKGVEIFYLSNRDTVEIGSTMANLKKFNLPDANADHMLFKRKESSKEARRQSIMSQYKVLMLVGDNLNDFADIFEKKNNVERSAGVDKMKVDWGTRFIVLPNVIYGEWENALFKYERNLTVEQKQIILRNLLIHE